MKNKIFVSLCLSGKKIKKAFTLIELVVAVALFAMVFAFAGMIFKVCINAYRTAVANAEIIQKLRAITDQLNADFEGLRKDGEIFVIWKAEPGSQERFDRIMFFADGDFQSYATYGGDEPIRGSVARICYMLANKPPVNIGVTPPDRPDAQKPEKRILARTQHILTADPQFAGSKTPTEANLVPLDWYNWNDLDEYEHADMNTLDKWKNMSVLGKQNALTVITDVNVKIDPVIDPIIQTENVRGTMVDLTDANLIHNIFCEGVGEFKIQGWYDAQQRWVPDSGDFAGLGVYLPGVLYPFPPYGIVVLGGTFPGNPDYPFQGFLNEAHFNDIPGLGRALKFTFTLYDSKAVIKNGRTFTHIVYIGD